MNVSLQQVYAQSERFVVHGHHPHVLQGIESVNEGLISYSLGNCLFDDCVSLDRRKHLRQLPENRRSVVLEVELSGGRIEGWRSTGLEDLYDQIILSEVPAGAAQRYSENLGLIDDPADYDRIRQDEIAANLSEEFGQRDLQWLLARPNYHSTVSRLLAVPRRREYRAIARRF